MMGEGSTSPGLGAASGRGESRNVMLWRAPGGSAALPRPGLWPARPVSGIQPADACDNTFLFLSHAVPGNVSQQQRKPIPVNSASGRRSRVIATETEWPATLQSAAFTGRKRASRWSCQQR